MPGGGIPIGAPRPGGIPIGGPMGGRMPGGGPIIPAAEERHERKGERQPSHNGTRVCYTAM